MSSIDELTGELARLPGVGRKTALRLVHHLLKAPRERTERLASALTAVRERVHECSVCGAFTETDPCEICTGSRRDRSTICIVEESADVGAIESAGEFRGLYHVLGGRLSPLDGIGPDELNMQSLMGRLEGGEVREVVIATNASVEGEATAVYLHQLVSPLGVVVSRIARGLPVGGNLEYADTVTIAEAFQHRRRIGDSPGPVRS